MRSMERYIFDDFWHIFSPSNNVNGLHIVDACKKLNIDLTTSEEQAVSKVFLTHELWMKLLEDEVTTSKLEN